MPTLSGKSCMVDWIIGRPPIQPVETARSVLRVVQRGLGSTPVVHARVTHREHGGVLVELEAAVDDLPEEQRVTTELDGLAHLAVDVGHGLVEDRRAGGAVV